MHPSDEARRALAAVAGLEAKEAGGSPEEIRAAEQAALDAAPDSGQTMTPKDARDLLRELRRIRVAASRPHPVLLAAIFAASDEVGHFGDALDNAEGLLAFYDDRERERREARERGGSND